MKLVLLTALVIVLTINMLVQSVISSEDGADKTDMFFEEVRRLSLLRLLRSLAHFISFFLLLWIMYVYSILKVFFTVDYLLHVYLLLIFDVNLTPFLYICAWHLNSNPIPSNPIIPVINLPIIQGELKRPPRRLKRIVRTRWPLSTPRGIGRGQFGWDWTGSERWRGYQHSQREWMVCCDVCCRKSGSFVSVILVYYF